MIGLSTGRISFGDLDLRVLPRESVRSRLNIIPQGPYFLHGSIRTTLDHFSLPSDEEIISAMSRTGLWEVAQDMGGLESMLNEEILSQEQKQLSCLARAMLRPGNILILDEATSSVDAEIDRLMQTIVRGDFKSHTVIVIAHRVDTVVDFDNVAVMEKGKLVEFDSPMSLLGIESKFKELCDLLQRRKDKTGEDITEAER